MVVTVEAGYRVGATSRYRALTAAHPLPAGNLSAQLTALAAAEVLIEGLTRAGRDLAVRVAKVGAEIQTRALAKVPAADLAICQGVFDAIERELDARLDIAAPAAE